MMKTWKKIFTFIIIVLVVALTLVLVFISPIAKYVIEKNSEEWIGRKVQIDKLRINILTGTIRLVDLKVFEPNGKTEFVKCNEFNTTINIFRLFNSEYEIKQLNFNGLYINVVQKGSHFNFDDIISHFADDKNTEKKPSSEPIKFWLKNIQLDYCDFRYENADYINVFEVQRLNVKCPLIAWDQTSMIYNYNFDLKTGGAFKGKFDFDIKSLKYHLDIEANKINLSILYPYLKPFIRIRTFEGFLDTQLSMNGNVENYLDLDAKGKVIISKIAITDTLGNTLTSIDEINIGIDSLNLEGNYYDFNKIYCNKPFLQFESYDSINNNWSRLMDVASKTDTVNIDTASFSNPFILIANYLGESVKSYLVSSYYADSLIMRNAEIQYRDYSLPEKVEMIIDNLNISTDRLNTDNKRLHVFTEARFNKAGFVSAKLAFDPKNYKDMEFSYYIKNVQISCFNPYMNYYVGWPFTQGDINYVGRTLINKGNLKSDNHFQVLKPLLGEKSKLTPQNKMPFRLAIGILKDPKGNIDFDIPVKGNIEDPDFRIGRIVWKIIGNLIIKSVTQPFNLLARAIGAKPEEEVRFIGLNYGKSYFNDIQFKSMKNLASSLKAKTDLNIIFNQQFNEADELEIIGSNEAKRQYAYEKQLLLLSDSLSARIYNVIDSISIKDSSFVSFINEKMKNIQLAMPIEEKCKLYVGIEQIKKIQHSLVEERSKNLLDFMSSHEIDPSRLSFNNQPDSNFAVGASPKFTYNIKVEENTNNEIIK